MGHPVCVAPCCVRRRCSTSVQEGTAQTEGVWEPAAGVGTAPPVSPPAPHVHPRPGHHPGEAPGAAPLLGAGRRGPGLPSAALAASALEGRAPSTTARGAGISRRSRPARIRGWRAHTCLCGGGLGRWWRRSLAKGQHDATSREIATVSSRSRCDWVGAMESGGMPACDRPAPLSPLHPAVGSHIPRSSSALCAASPRVLLENAPSDVAEGDVAGWLVRTRCEGGCCKQCGTACCSPHAALASSATCAHFFPWAPDTACAVRRAVGPGAGPGRAEAFTALGARCPCSWHAPRSHPPASSRPQQRHPSVLDCWPEFEAALEGKRVALFSDYDGACAPLPPTHTRPAGSACWS